ncbi:hypothetical protein I0D00_02315 [Pseudomonas lalucatii]|uniref:DUF3509 domain-containing protein n=1 Tax=Pseudomonas lalucatii TaxID=1424203 RepID=A0ABS5PWS8_9PSED|nr:hypothetical protein [Pseudomonas lalucatii]MBS7660784.1 hypothetical protein [Pseudomonas lalucatii]MBS7724450.1 hypothetical protein [Pseudomonas lalucatii]QVM87556.1 hypothetical protein I0D68_21295 [Pseudomonas lalucatii]
MNTQQQLRTAMHTLSSAFAPHDCRILAARNGSFSFTIVNHAGIAQHSQRLYPGQYGDESLQQVIRRARQTLRA